MVCGEGAIGDGEGVAGKEAMALISGLYAPLGWCTHLQGKETIQRGNWLGKSLEPQKGFEGKESRKLTAGNFSYTFKKPPVESQEQSFQMR